ncbi:MAG: DEAD/DEAH box helicase [Balneolaceae bacterium]
MKFSELNLTDELLSGLTDINFIEATPVQEKAIPHVLDKKDIIGTAQTGTGKTGAFVIPIVDRILRGERDGIKAIILTPTRELAQQIDEQIFAIGYHTGITSATVIGGSDFSAQAKALKAGVDIIVATPGRFIDQNKIVNIDFSTVEYLVLDEADRMLDMGFLPDMTKIIGWIPKNRQTLLFSATMPKEIEKLASSIMQDPVTIEIARSKPAQSVEQRAYLLKSNQKIPLVKQIFDNIKWDSCIIFTSTKKGTDELQRLLKKQGIKAGSIHGDRSQDERNRALNAFKNGEIPVIVATNVIARGIDIKDVSMIINYDVPRSADDYVHRIGRTGRYDKSGIAVTLVTKRDSRAFGDIDRIRDNRLKKIHLSDTFDSSSEFRWNQADMPGKKPGLSNGNEENATAGSGSDKTGRKKGSNGQSAKSGDENKRRTKKPAGSKESRKSDPSSTDKKRNPARSGRPVKQSSSRQAEKSEVKEETRSREGADRSGNSRAPDRGTSEKKADTNHDRRETNRASVISAQKVEKARERNRHTRQPAKGVWGIIKSVIPRFKRD